MKKVLFMAFLTGILFMKQVNSQEFRDRLITSLGYGLHFSLLPTQVYAFTDPFGDDKYFAEDVTGLSPYSYLGDFRLNLMEPSKESALSVKVSPELGFEFSKLGFGSFRLPLVLEYNMGAGSTYDSKGERGFFAGAGIQYLYSGLLGGKGSDIEERGGNVKKSHIQPVLVLGYRYWNLRNRMKEVGLTFGFGPGGDAIPASAEADGEVTSSRSGLFIGFTVKRFLNY